MKSIFVKILVWFAVTLIVCLAGLMITNRLRFRFAPGSRDFFSRSLSFEVAEARHAYETGGSAALRDYFARLGTYFPGTHVLVDARGIDLATGADINADLRNVGPRWSPSTQSRMAILWPSPDVKYRLLINAPSPPGPWNPLPSYLWIAGMGLVFCYILAVELAGPLRTLEQKVERFGRGDLAVRAPARRRDGFGKLAAAFNVMAARIETLLTAERRLLQDVSHELRSPLARLKFAVELARTSSDRDSAMDRINKEVERLSSLVSELLEVTRAESDPENRRADEIAVPGLLKDLVEDSAVEAEAQNKHVRLIINGEPVMAKGDKELLRRAVENVIRNAIRYTPQGSEVEVQLHASEGTCVIGVRDYGPGVPQSSLPNLFKPFYRVETDRSRIAGGGMGLGLSIAERAIALHEGTIRARNASPGLLVEIELPAQVVGPALNLSHA
ncbi:MAG: HAMP domain-containing protein [Acidobacteriaceae bacterium]|nr:HAMP domain-containing protein [Acidobacteriaceae bacterium]